MTQLPSSPPEKFSEQIKMAVADMKLCEADPNYEINMNKWHIGDSFWPKCHVCMAGAVMAKTHDIKPTVNAFPNEFDTEWHKVFKWLDALQGNNTLVLLEFLSDEQCYKLMETHSHYDRENPEPFYKWTDEIIEALESVDA